MEWCVLAAAHLSSRGILGDGRGGELGDVVEISADRLLRYIICTCKFKYDCTRAEEENSGRTCHPPLSCVFLEATLGR